MSWRYSSLAVTFIALLVAGCAVDGATATEDTAAGPAAAGALDLTAPHCVRQIGSETTSCFGTFTEAIAAATGQQITDGPADPSAARTDEVFRARLNALGAAARSHTAAAVFLPPATVVIAIEYQDINFQGSTLTYTAPTGCDGDLSTLDYVVTAITPDSWNDQISSFIAFSNCVEQLYEHANFGGAQTPLTASLSSVGEAMNDRASSIKWF